MITLDEWFYSPPKKIVKYPDKILFEETHPILTFDSTLRKVVSKMFDIMYTFDGVGLAAPQVGLPYRIFVCNPTGRWEQTNEEHAFINPELIAYGARKSLEVEGCLSIPGVFGKISRPRKFMFSAYDANGKKDKFAFNDKLARVCQHEFDHLFQTLIINRMDQEDLKKHNHILNVLESHQ